MHKNISCGEKKILLKKQTCDLLSIHKTNMAACCLENAWHIYYNCKYCSTFEIQGGFFYLYIDEQRNVLYVEFEFAEKYTCLLQNTCSFPIKFRVHFIKCGQMYCLFIKYCIDCTKYFVHREMNLKNRTAHTFFMKFISFFLSLSMRFDFLDSFLDEQNNLYSQSYIKQKLPNYTFI